MIQIPPAAWQEAVRLVAQHETTTRGITADKRKRENQRPRELAGYLEVTAASGRCIWRWTDGWRILSLTLPVHNGQQDTALRRRVVQIDKSLLSSLLSPGSSTSITADDDHGLIMGDVYFTPAPRSIDDFYFRRVTSFMPNYIETGSCLLTGEEHRALLQILKRLPTLKERRQKYARQWPADVPAIFTPEGRGKQARVRLQIVNIAEPAEIVLPLMTVTTLPPCHVSAYFLRDLLAHLYPSLQRELVLYLPCKELYLAVTGYTPHGVSTQAFIWLLSKKEEVI